MNKNLIILTTIILSMSVTGCSQEINREDLIGTWYLQKVEEGNDSSTFFTYRDCASIEFLSDNQMLSNNTVSTSNGTWQLKSNQLDCKNFLGDGTIENIHFDIENLSTNELVVLDINNNKLLYFTHKCDPITE